MFAFLSAVKFMNPSPGKKSATGSNSYVNNIMPFLVTSGEQKQHELLSADMN